VRSKGCGPYLYGIVAFFSLLLMSETFAIGGQWLSKLVGNSLSTESSVSKTTTSKANTSVWRQGREYVSIRSVLSPLGAHFTSPDARSLKVSRGPAVLDFTRDGNCFFYNNCKIFLGVPFFWEKQQLYVAKCDFISKIEPLIHPQGVVSKVSSPKTIVLDAGHGGKDPGTSARGICEKTWTLDVVKGLRDQLTQLGYHVVLTRDQDKFVSLADRVAITKRAQADLFVSIHFNACASKSAHGFEIFTFPAQGTSATHTGTRLKSQSSVSVANHMFSGWNTVLAYSIHSCIKEAFPNLGERGVKQGRLLVLRNNPCPSILIEVAFMTNEKDFALFTRAEKRHELARAIVGGIQKYAANLQHIQH
jgi:N-acetylmuramoyl-L-alanine amidase